MADFSSALYLGLHHPGCTLDQRDGLTLGKPAALQDPPGARHLAAELAALQGCACATLLPSTLHLFWDLFGVLAQQRLAILIEGGAYPVARWGAERACALGMPTQVFPCGDVSAARRLARLWMLAGRRPLILADGYYPGAQSAPPLAAYAGIAQAGAGYLVLDDTQALGLFGRAGGGSLALHGLTGAHIVLGASLAKAFGAPLAVLAGSAALLRCFEAHSQTRLHNSPPSAAAIAAAQRALRLNRECGAALRQRLHQRVMQWRAEMAAAGIVCRGGAFPVQSVPLPPHVDGAALHAALLAGGVQAVRSAGALLFLLRADHRPGDISAAVAALEHHLQEVV